MILVNLSDRSPPLHLTDFSDILALLHLFKKIIFTDVVQPACILSVDNNFEGDLAVVSGWGWTLEGII